jgi:hypothetical protein
MDRTARIVAGEGKDMTDRELLELAAKAAGSPLKSDDAYPFPTRVPIGWNPLTDDGDALRLAVKLGIGQRHHVGWMQVFSPQIGVADSNYEGDPYAATRRAIVMAAATLGKEAHESDR